tara:strand:+ start:608 stop:1519 length:912 start_codon:yes stop_codon:yes gene_type:complete
MPTIRPIADIKANLLRPAFTSQFEVEIPLNTIPKSALNAAGIILNTTDKMRLNLLCSEATLPGSKLMTTEIDNDRTGVTEYHAHRRMYEQETEFTFYVNADNYIPIRIFECWMDWASGVGVKGSFGKTEDERKDVRSPNYFYRMRYPDDYIADQGLKIIKYERDWTKSEANLSGGTLEYEFIRAFPVAINSMPVTYDASDLLKVSVRFSYIRYVMNKGWHKESTEDALGFWLGAGKKLITGDLEGLLDTIRSGQIPAAVANAVANSFRSLATFVGGEELADNFRGAARWAKKTWEWAQGIGRQ